MRGIQKEFEIKRKPFFKLKLFFLEKLALILLIIKCGTSKLIGNGSYFMVLYNNNVNDTYLLTKSYFGYKYKSPNGKEYRNIVYTSIKKIDGETETDFLYVSLME
jgi:hypothetical protein